MQLAQQRKRLRPVKREARLGQISFINSLPIVLPLERNYLGIDAQMVMDHPAALNACYAEGSLDLGAMSSFFYLQQTGLELIANLSISSQGAVGSVLFFSKVKFASLYSARIAVPSQSATSVNLLAILLREDFGVSPHFVSCTEADLDREDLDAALVLGDRALMVDKQWSEKFWRKDLGQWWAEKYEKPMVFGVWAARRQWLARYHEQFHSISDSLKLSKSLGLGLLFEQVVLEAQKRCELTLDRLEHYFCRQLNFDLTEGHLAGLQLYKSLCQKYGLFG